MVEGRFVRGEDTATGVQMEGGIASVGVEDADEDAVVVTHSTEAHARTDAHSYADIHVVAYAHAHHQSQAILH